MSSWYSCDYIKFGFSMIGVHEFRRRKSSWYLYDYFKLGFSMIFGCLEFTTTKSYEMALSSWYRRVCVWERKRERGREREGGWVSEWVSEWVSDWVSEWVSEWASACACVYVCFRAYVRVCAHYHPCIAWKGLLHTSPKKKIHFIVKLNTRTRTQTRTERKKVTDTSMCLYILM